MADLVIEITIGKADLLVGEFFLLAERGRRKTAFRYSQSWLDDPRAFAIAPDLPLSADLVLKSLCRDGGHIPLPIQDVAPDSWGRRVLGMALMESPSHGTEFHALLGVNDHLRAGALRFRARGSSQGMLASERGFSLDGVSEAARQIRFFEEDPFAYVEWAEESGEGRLVEAVGSLGGARPKAWVVDEEGIQWMLKPPRLREDVAIARGEVLALTLASELGITAAKARLVECMLEHPASLVRRFDRIGAARIPYISAQTMLGCDEAVGATYEDLEMRMRGHCADVANQLLELYRRMMFGLLVRNTDDHLRNHGFLRGADGWRLSPAFDINPEPRSLGWFATGVSEIHPTTIEGVVEAGSLFGVAEKDAQAMSAEMTRHIRGRWREIGADLGMTPRDVEYFGEAIEPSSLRQGLAGRS